MQIVLSVIGVLATVAFGAWAVVLALRSGRGVQFTFAQDQCLSLIDDVTHKVQNLSISYSGEPITDNLVLIRGYLINTGTRDVSPDMVEHALRLPAPPGYRWREAKVSETSKDLEGEALVLPSGQIEFRHGLWKKKECLNFTALAQKTKLYEEPTDGRDSYFSPRQFFEMLGFTHRIADCDDVAKVRILPDYPRRRFPLFPFAKFRRFTAIYAMSAFLVVAGIFMIIETRFVDSQRVGFEVDHDGKALVVSASVRKNHVVLRGEGDFRRSLTLGDFRATNPKPTFVKDPAFPVLYVAGGIYVLLGIVCLSLFALALMHVKHARIHGICQ
jgi:hypothetical protein